MVDSMRLSDYQSIDVNISRPLGTKVFIKWEMRNKDILGGKLILPNTHRGTQFTGIIMKTGGCVPNEYGMVEGQRVIFRQFSGFEKAYDEKEGRIAIVDYFHVINPVPKRADVESGEEDWDYNA